MTLHQASKLNGRPVYSLDIPESLSGLLHKTASDWPHPELEKPVTILVLCDFTSYGKVQLQPLAAWLCGLGAVHVATWPGNESPVSGQESELCEAVDDYDRDVRLEALRRAVVDDGLEIADAGAEVAAEHGAMDVSTWFYGRIELDDALQGFFFSIDMSEEGRASRSVLIATIGNPEWAARVRQRLEDGKWLSQFEFGDEPSDDT